MPDTLFDVNPSPMDFGDVGKPLAHTDGPTTSHEAIERHTESGKRETHCDAVETLVASFSGRTSRELACVWPSHSTAEDIDLTELRRRLTDLLNQGRVKQGEPRKCRVAGTQAVTWEVV